MIRCGPDEFEKETDMKVADSLVNRSLYTLGENSEIEFWKKIPEFGKYELPA